MVHNQRRRGQKRNANNQRVKKTNTDTHETTLYAWTSDRIFGEYDAQGNLIQETVYLGNTPFGILKPDGVYRIYADQVDTPRLITDDTNRPVWQWDARPFGDSQPNEDLDGNGTPFHYNLRFPGQYYDAETKTHYNFNRDYDPETGRYVQSDPIGLDGGVNNYTYTRNNSLIGTDILGLFCLSCHGETLLDWFNPEPEINSVVLSRLPLDKGGEEWGRKNGVGAKEGRRRAHKIKQNDNMSGATDNYTVDPNTGDVYDPEGDYVGNLGNDYN